MPPSFHAVERLRDVRPHRLALAVGERAVVAAAVRVGVDARGRELRLGGDADRTRRRSPALDLDDLADADADAHGRDRAASGNRIVTASAAVGARDVARRPRAEVEVRLAGQVPRVRNAVDVAGSNSRG